MSGQRPQNPDAELRSVVVRQFASVLSINSWMMSYRSYKAGDCVKVLVGHPTEFPRLFELKPGERCE
jgi:hypothetical protein